ncbi:MAG: pyridoxamine 5'-phosphate oxidase [Rhodospirillaceae bacterium]|nr:MAG: pyridoxamine 5'-phosphate oxidase [Rhodospirillaceae bacterium]
MDSAPQITPTDDPLVLFQQWFAEAAAREPGLPEAMSLATATRDGRPSVRMVLLKGFATSGFVFYTNTHSRKGREIAENPFGALCLYWKSLSRQVRIEGPFSAVTVAEADAYFDSRPRDSQLAAWASLQSEPLAARATLLERFKAAQARYDGGPVPRPHQWSGYRLRPESIEFWQDISNRLHDRLVYERSADARWQWRRLYP